MFNIWNNIKNRYHKMNNSISYDHPTTTIFVSNERYSFKTFLQTKNTQKSRKITNLRPPYWNLYIHILLEVQSVMLWKAAGVAYLKGNQKINKRKVFKILK
jgi:hypothetical protein